MGDAQVLRIKSDNLAVLLIDMQDHYIGTQEKKNLIPNQISVLRLCFLKGIPVFFAEAKGYGNTTKELRCVIESNHSECYRKIIKSNNDAFVNTDLSQQLKEKKIRSLILMGVNACACVYETAVTAVKKRYKLITSQDLIAGYCRECRSKRLEIDEWYREHTRYVPYHHQILRELDPEGDWNRAELFTGG